MIKTYSYEDRVLIVWSIGALEFRICFVIRASYFEFDIQPPVCPLSSVLCPLTSFPLNSGSCLPVGISVTVRASVPRMVPRIIIRVIRPDILSLLGPEMNLHGLNDRIYIGEIS